MMTVGSVGYLGSAPASAVYGLASVFLYVLPAFVFLIPVSLVAAELASGWEGGVYNWVREGVSAPMGLLAVWCEFAQTIFYYPALLAFVASTLAYVIDPGLAGNGVYNAVIIIVLFWLGVLVTSGGVNRVAELSSTGTVIGTLIPGALLVVFGIVYLIEGNHSAAPITAQHLLPQWSGLASIVLIVNSFFTYAGIEVNAVHVDEMQNPSRDYPKSIFLAMALVLALFILPDVGDLLGDPFAQISFTAGVMQAFNTLFHHFGVGFAVPLIALALAIGALAGMMAWLGGPSEGLLRIGREQGFLPPYFQKVNARGIEMHILTAQATVITLIALLYAFIPSVSHDVLDLRRHGDSGLPDHVRADVRRRLAVAPLTTGSASRVSGARLGRALPAGRVVVRRSACHWVHPSVAIRPSEPGDVRPLGSRGHPPHRNPAALLARPLPQTKLEGHQQRLVTELQRARSGSFWAKLRGAVRRKMLTVGLFAVLDDMAEGARRDAIQDATQGLAHRILSRSPTTTGMLNAATACNSQRSRGSADHLGPPLCRG